VNFIFPINGKLVNVNALNTEHLALGHINSIVLPNKDFLIRIFPWFECDKTKKRPHSKLFSSRIKINYKKIRY